MRNLENYAKEVTAEKATATRTNYLHAVKLFIAATRCQSIERVKVDHARKFAEYLKRNTPSKKTARYYYNITRSIFQQAANEGIINNNPLGLIKPIKGDKGVKVGAGRAKALTREELSALIRANCTDEIVKNAFLFSCETGLRISDIETLDYSEIKEVDGMLHIVKDCRKTGIKLNVPLTKKAAAMVNNGKGRGLVFTLPKLSTGSTNRMYVFRVLKEWAKFAKVDKNLSFHTARHTFCTNVYNATGDILVTKELAGHSDIATTARYYAAVTNKTLQNAIKSL